MSEERKIGRYIIKKVLGKGSMGCVYEAFDPNLQRPVAIKTIRANLEDDPRDSVSFKDRFLREALTTSHLSHPNIVAVYDTGIHEGEPFLVMEYVAGRSLEKLLHGNLSEELPPRLRLLQQMAAGLDYAHRKGVIHRDIKPSNILVTEELNAKIADFGLAKLHDSKMTNTGVFLGTPSYSSPEQITSGNVDHRTDIFSFSMVAYEVITGARPFPGDNINSILYHIVHTPPDLSFGTGNLSSSIPGLRKVFNKALHKDPLFRYECCSLVVYELEKALGLTPTTVIVPSPGGVSPAIRLSDMGASEFAENAAPPGDMEETMILKQEPFWMVWVMEYRWLLTGAATFIFALVIWLSWSGGTSSHEGAGQASRQTGIGLPQISQEQDSEYLSTGSNSSRETDHLRTRQFFRANFLDLIEKQRYTEAGQILEKMRGLGLDTSRETEILEVWNGEKNKSVGTSFGDQRLKIVLHGQFQRAQKEANVKKMRETLDKYAKRWPRDAPLLGAWETMLSDRENRLAESVRLQRSLLEKADLTKDPAAAKRALDELERLQAAQPADVALVQELNENVFINSLDMKFIRVPAGEYILEKQHSSTYGVPRDFFMGMFEVTQFQYEQVTKINPSRFKGAHLPVESVSWKDVNDFAKRLNEIEGVNSYRLPTEVEWELACRAGSGILYPFDQVLGPYLANFKEHDLGHTISVGHFPPNSWGIHDLYGNVSEFCFDVYGTYPKGVAIDPWLFESGGVAPSVLRGGSFESSGKKGSATFRAKPRILRSSSRRTGFRLVKLIDSSQ